MEISADPPDPHPTRLSAWRPKLAALPRRLQRRAKLAALFEARRRARSFGGFALQHLRAEKKGWLELGALHLWKRGENAEAY